MDAEDIFAHIFLSKNLHTQVHVIQPTLGVAPYLQALIDFDVFLQNAGPIVNRCDIYDLPNVEQVCSGTLRMLVSKVVAEIFILEVYAISVSSIPVNLSHIEI